MEITIEIPNYIRRVELSKSRKAMYYVAPRKPKAAKWLSSQYGFMHTKIAKAKTGKYRSLWCNLLTGEPVLRNPQSAGTPKSYLINGQDLYNQNIVSHTRNKVKNAISEHFIEHLKDIPVITEFPINIKVELHDFIRDLDSNGMLWDVDNRFFGWYAKVLQDTLKELKKIPDDNTLFITMPPAVKFIPLYPMEQRKLVITIATETDPRILNHPAYRNGRPTF